MRRALASLLGLAFSEWQLWETSHLGDPAFQLVFSELGLV